MADPVTASIVLGVLATSSATAGAVSTTIQAEGAKDIAEEKTQAGRKQAGIETHQALSRALAQEGTTSQFKTTAVDQILDAERQAQVDIKRDEQLAKHDADVQIANAWIDVGITAAMSGMAIGSAKAEAAKLAGTGTTTTTAGGAGSNLMMQNPTNIPLGPLEMSAMIMG